jgi:hypothetical protein
LFCSFSLARISTFGGKRGGSPPPPFAATCLILGSSGSSAAFVFSGPGYSFDFFKDADSNVAPPPYLGTAVGASDQAVIGRTGTTNLLLPHFEHLRGASGMALAVHSG